jgi:exopolyphosphatase/guanosine-5'-triphosphate,3'-diphosphate pyrophosphatase
MRVAVIDLGTNTFNLLIADCESNVFNVLHSEKEGVAIGMGGINDNFISPEGWKRAIKALVRFKSVCDSFQVASIRAIGTSSIRSAKNGLDFKKEVESETGIVIDIVTGLQEAELIFKGISWSYDFSDPAVIMDIGGGSTEFVWADQSGIQEALSLDMGVSRLFQDLELNDPLSKEDVLSIENWLEMKANKQLDNKKSDLLIGASGTFETFYELHYRKRYPNSKGVLKIDKVGLEKVLQEIIESSMEERNQNKFIIDIRKKMAPIAAVKTQWVMNKLGIKKILISPFSLKEGVLKG